MSDSLRLTPADLVGAVQRALIELHTYLQQPGMAVDVNACVSHLDRVQNLLGALQEMQIAAAQGAKGEGSEMRKN